MGVVFPVALNWWTNRTTPRTIGFPLVKLTHQTVSICYCHTPYLTGDVIRYPMYIKMKVCKEGTLSSLKRNSLSMNIMNCRYESSENTEINDYAIVRFGISK